MALEPSRADILDTERIQLERGHHRPFVARIGSVGGQSVNAWRQALRLPVRVQLSKISVKGAVLLQHEDDVIDCGNVPGTGAGLSVDQAPRTPGQKEQDACCNKQEYRSAVHQVPQVPLGFCEL